MLLSPKVNFRTSAYVTVRLEGLASNNVEVKRG